MYVYCYMCDCVYMVTGIMTNNDTYARLQGVLRLL